MAKKVLFLSSGNSTRSQMAEAFLRQLAGDVYQAKSAGSTPRDVHPLARAVMAECGIDIGDQRAKAMQEYMGKEDFDHLITVCERGEKDCPMFPGKGTREFWPVSDPARDAGTDDELTAGFRETRDYIEERVRRFLVERRYKPVPEDDPDE